MAKTNDFKIRNYTSVIVPEKSQAAIEDLLVRGGATEMTRMYKDKKIVGYFFRLPVPDGLGIAREVQFRMPCEVEACTALMLKGLHSYDNNYARRKMRIETQAVRTAWATLAEWVHIQLSMVALKQVEPLQAFMPYAYDERTKQTYYERLKADRFEMLTLPAGGARGELSIGNFREAI